MNLSMWMIAEKLEKYQPKYDIKDGFPCITGLRFISGEEQIEFEKQFVYLCIDNEDVPSESAALVNGRDIIIVHSNNVNDIINDLLVIFEYYNHWESLLWEASAKKSLQEVLDLANQVLENPMILADMTGKILAMSSVFLKEDINEYWVESRESHYVPAAILGSPLHNQEKMMTVWGEEPDIYFLPDETKTIGVFLTESGEKKAALALWEYQKPIHPGHVALTKILCDVLITMFMEYEREVPLRSSASIIADLLSGVEIDAVLLEKLELRCRSPWKILLIDNPFHSNEVYKNNLIQRMKDTGIPCIPLVYNDYVLSLVSSDQAQILLNRVLGEREQKYYLAVVTLSFTSLQKLKIRYEQGCDILRQKGKNPGIYHGEEFGFGQMVKMAAGINKEQCLTHPALERLKQYDAEKHGELYETLYQYLLHERSILHASEAMHIHRNSFLYRIQRIEKILGMKFDDPQVRSYLLMSFMIEKYS